MNNIPSDIYKLITQAYCDSMKCGIPRDTCLSLGKCEECENFERKLTEIDNVERGN